MKGGERGGVIRIPLFLFVPRREKRAQGAVRVPCPLHHSKKIFNVLACHPPVDEVLEPRNRPLVPRLEKIRRPRPESREDTRHRGLDRRDAAEGEGGGEEGHDFAIRRIPELVGEDERIRIEAAGAPLPPQGLEALAEEGEVSGASRAPSHAPTLASLQ